MQQLYPNHMVYNKRNTRTQIPYFKTNYIGHIIPITIQTNRLTLHLIPTLIL